LYREAVLHGKVGLKLSLLGSAHKLVKEEKAKYAKSPSVTKKIEPMMFDQKNIFLIAF
jgi:hypothetical protein